MADKFTRIPADLDRELSPRAREFVLGLIGEVKRLRRENAELRKRMEVLEAKLEKLTPQNSSLPPSTVHPHARPKPGSPKTPRDGKRRKQGAQPGHPRHTRPLVPSEACDRIIDLRPKRCRKCAEKLSGSDSDPLRHQVIELPPIKPTIFEYRRHRLTCCCGESTCGELPVGVPTGQCGPRLAAFCGLLMGHFRQSRRRAASFLTDIFNIPCSTGWTVKIQNLVSAALAGPYEELRSQLASQSQLFVDESPTKEHKRKAWLWVAVAPLLAVFGIFASRKRTSLRALIGDYKGIIINCDRAKMYFDGDRLQWCWAHLKRDIQKLVDSPDRKVKRLGYDLRRQQRLLFEWWEKRKSGQITWQAFQAGVKPVRDEFNSLLVRGCYSGNSRQMGFCEELDWHRNWLWTFTEVEGIEPTNNAAERALRPAVIQRKLSFGTQSAAGSRFLERLLTVSETCRLQNRSPYQYLVSLMQTTFKQQPAPSLLPASKPPLKKAA
jgi:transposase